VPVIVPPPHDPRPREGARQRWDQQSEGPQRQARLDRGHVGQLDQRDQDADQEDLHHAPGAQVLEPAECRYEAGRSAPEPERRQHEAEHAELQCGSGDRGEEHQRSHQPLILRVQLADARAECRLGHLALHVEPEEGEGIRHREQHHAGDGERQRALDAVGPMAP